MRYICIVFLVAGLMSSFTAISQESQRSQKDVFQSSYNASKKKIQSQKYQFIGGYVYNNKNREKIDDNSNTFIINTSNVKGSLTSLSTEKKTFILDGMIRNYEAVFNDDKQTIRVEFKVETESEMYDVFIDVKSNGNAFLTVKKSPMDIISWTGKIKAL
ncbi:DUF4251 domain-containing protein [Winogradskyella aurantia]|uniref:DUF4251 domain-containing protein n=1 Tax=Winogradskyella aurantia TaxID=1915063 RepID=A0A265UT54_9FLAO|nr:DUF4251 domain-containing protein [Winogradskyella aurantia]OZV68495.1 hypothetical protein CA834_08445 [Winogradskyella aurantia]